MTDEPLVLQTSAGPIAAILTLPDDEAKAIALIFPGSGGTRAGVNQTWVRIARGAREHGVATLRADYAATGESWDANAPQRSAAVRDIARWACERTNDVPLLLISNCVGLWPALSVCRDRAVAGTAVILPPVLPARAPGGPVPGRLTVGDRVQTKLGHLRVLPRRIAYRLRYGSARHVRWTESELGRPIKDLGELVSRTPTALLMGSEDTCTEPVRELLPRLRDLGAVEMTVIDGLALRAASTPETQDAMCDTVAAWLARSTGRLEAPT